MLNVVSVTGVTNPKVRIDFTKVVPDRISELKALNVTNYSLELVFSKNVDVPAPVIAKVFTQLNLPHTKVVAMRECTGRNAAAVGSVLGNIYRRSLSEVPQNA